MARLALRRTTRHSLLNFLDPVTFHIGLSFAHSITLLRQHQRTALTLLFGTVILGTRVFPFRTPLPPILLLAIPHSCIYPLTTETVTALTTRGVYCIISDRDLYILSRFLKGNNQDSKFLFLTLGLWNFMTSRRMSISHELAVISNHIFLFLEVHLGNVN